MKAFINWSSLSSLRLIMMMQLSFLLLPLLQIGFIAIESFRYDLKKTINTAGLAFILTIVFIFISGSNFSILLGLVFFNLLIGSVVGKLIKHRFHLAHAFRLLIVVILILITGALIFLQSPVDMIDSIFMELNPILLESGFTNDEVAISREVILNRFFGAMFWVLFIQTLIGIFIAYHWCGYLDESIKPSTAFHHLKLGRKLGFFLIFLILCSQLTSFNLIANLSMIAWTAICICGLSVAHHRLSVYSFGWAFLMFIYIGLIMPISINYVALILVIIGMIDIFINLRNLRKKIK